MFIDLFVGQIDLGAGGDDQRELDSLRAWASLLKKDVLNACENQFAHRATVCAGLRLEPAIKRRGNIDRGANAILLHKVYYPMCAINMESSKEKVALCAAEVSSLLVRQVPRFFAPLRMTKSPFE